MSISLRDVAAQLNLSPGLVSRVLNNVEGVRVSKQTRQRIHETAQSLQYRPSPSARALSTGRSRQIAISGADEGLHNYLSSRLLEQQGLIEQVDHDNYRYTYDAVAWLREQGHTRIGFTDFLAAALQPFASDLHQGYQDAMNALCAGFNPAHVLDAQAGHAERLALVQNPHAPTALIVRDWRGANAWRVVLQTHGARVPQDITILAQIAITEREYLEPGFAYQAHDPRALGLRAGEMLLNRIETGSPTEAEVIRLPVMPPKWRPDWFSE